MLLIDLKRDPADRESLAAKVPALVRRVRRLAPKIIVIKSSAFDLVRDPLLNAGLPVVDERARFAGTTSSDRLLTPSTAPVSAKRRRDQIGRARARRRGAWWPLRELSGV